MSNSTPDSLDDWLLPSTAELFGRIRRGYGVDLEAYRSEVLRLQLKRRMLALGLHTVAEYLELTSRDSAEFRRLMDSLLIGSTSFFRDPLSFSSLREHLLKEGVGDQAEARAWVAGCSTGEEAYSLAITLLEVLALRGESRTVRVYATDLRSSSVERARRGLYSSAALGGIPTQLRDTYFVASAGGYRVSSRLREAIVFGQHDLLADPPFCKMDVISCRNVLLYMQESAQQRLLGRFYFGLRPTGVLFLGPAESTSVATGLFRARDREHRVYVKAAHGGA